MCGIVGIVVAGRSHPAASETVRRMAESLEHRGPDSDGFHEVDGVHLGMRRLAVIDPLGGDQPLYNEDRTVAVVCNGEIYNFAELREELQQQGHHFRTASDTEVIVHLYEERGLDCFGELNGMFAIAIHDMRQKRVVLARDPHGMKPLYWMQDSNGLRFASEMKALFADPLISRRPDFGSLLDYLVHWYVPTPSSAFEGIRKLIPGGMLIADSNGQVEEIKFARNPVVRHSRVDNLHDASKRSLHALEDAVRRQLVADVPVGVFLSGGLDSGIIAALVARLASRRTRAFTVAFDGFPSYNEAPIAASIARRVGLDHVVIRFPEDPTELVRRALATFDEPFGDYSSVAMSLLCQEARQYATVCLSGDGGDEVFAGYPHYKAPRYASLYRRLPGPGRTALAYLVGKMPTSFERISLDYMAKRFVRGAGAPPLEAHLLYKAVFFGDERDGLLGPVLSEVAQRGPMDGLRGILDELKSGQGSLTRRLLMLDRATFLLDDNLVKVDRTSMASSLEVRLPMLDHMVVDTADSIPANLHLKNGQTKAVLREVASQLLPDEAKSLKKKGFSPPMSHWLLGPLRGVVEEYLAPEKVRKAGLVRPEVVSQMIAEHRARKHDRCRELWTLLALHEWWARQGF